jgi:hypothetical protein
VRTRFATRFAAIVIGAAVPVLVFAAPALAKTKPDDGEGHNPHDLSTLGVLVRFVFIPLGAFLLIAALCVLPSALSRPRYRPGKPWDHEPLWVGGPDDATDAATAGAGAGSQVTARGGASAEW